MRPNKFFEKLTYNWQIKIISVVAAIGIYYLVSFASLGSRSLSIPVDVKLPDGMIAVSNVPESINLRISGDPDIVYLVDPSKIEASLDFSAARQPGIATAPVILELPDGIFDLSEIAITAEPSVYRVMFEANR